MTVPSRRFAPAVHRLEDRSVPAAVGTVDPTFGTGGRLVLNLGAADQVNAVVVQRDQKILLAGSTAADGDPAADFFVARLLPNGTLDPTFGAGGVRVLNFGGSDIATGLGLLSDGRIVVGGYTSTATTAADFALARLTADGNLDASFANNGQGQFGQLKFDLGRGAADKAYALAITPTNRVYLAGASGTDMAVARVDENGVVDRGFGPTATGAEFIDLGGTEEAHGVGVLPDGRVVVGGFTTPAGGTADFAAVRLLADGTAVDTTFGNTTVNGVRVSRVDLGGDDKAYAEAVQTDGRVVLAGARGGGVVSDLAVVRLDAAGNLDGTFAGSGIRLISVGRQAEARAISGLADGRIVVAGFTSADPAQTGDFLVDRLQADGSDDPTFGGARTVDFGGDDRAFAAAPDAAGRIVAAGRSSADSAVTRVIGSPGLSRVLLASGLSDGSGQQFVGQNGSFGAGQAFNVFPGFTGTVRVATGDVTGDGVADRIVGVGPGGGPEVVVYDGRTGQLVASFFAFEPTFLGGVLLAAGDFNGDGKADLVVTADVGGGPRVRIFDGAALATNTQKLLADFFGIDDPNFRGGARPAVGDVNGDGVPDLIVAAGVGGGPRIAVFDGKTIGTQGTPSRLVPDFFAFEESVRNGAFVSAGDVNGDGFADLIFGAGPGGAPRVRIISGKALVGVPVVTSIDAVPGLQLASYLAGPADARGGVTVTAKDVDGDQLADVVTGSGQGQRSEIRLYRGTTLLANGSTPAPDQTIDPFAAILPTGVFVG